MKRFHQLSSSEGNQPTDFRWFGRPHWSEHAQLHAQQTRDNKEAGVGVRQQRATEQGLEQYYFPRVRAEKWGVPALFILPVTDAGEIEAAAECVDAGQKTNTLKNVHVRTSGFDASLSLPPALMPLRRQSRPPGSGSSRIRCSKKSSYKIRAEVSFRFLLPCIR